ncbi:MAG: O-antigen ligase family protein [Bacteroidetes bacterium]|nr:O-antigen ligase family protein [Bacteroidota bacterium]
MAIYKESRENFFSITIWYLIIILIASDIFSIAIVQTSAVILALIWLLKILLADKYKWVSTSLDKAFLIFIAARIISIPLSIDPMHSLPRFLQEIFFYVIFFIITNEFDVNNRKRIVLVIRIIFLSGVISSLYGSFIFLNGSAERASSTTGGYFTLGIYLVLVLSLILFAGRSKEIIPKKYIWYILILIVSGGLFCTLNRIHWVCMTILIILTSVIYKDKKSLFLFLLFGIAAILIVPDIFNRFYKLINLFSYTSERDIIYRAAWDMALDRPLFGYGLATFKLIFPYFDKITDTGVNSWHNDFIQIYMESGIVGLGSYLFLFFMIIKTGIENIKNLKGNTLLRNLCISILAGTSLIILTGGFFDPISSILMFFLLGLMALINNNVKAADLMINY